MLYPALLNETKVTNNVMQNFKLLISCQIFDYSPFYGQRRPMLQSGAKLLCVSDLLLLGRATIEEARSLLHWLDSEAGFGKMGICGLSMGMPQSRYLGIMVMKLLTKFHGLNHYILKFWH